MFKLASFILMLALVKSAGADTLAFPSGFKWCVATAAHQVEGGNVNSDWWAFEQVPGHIKNGDRSGLADDHWNRLEEDTKLLQDLGVQRSRLSIEWAKIEPQEGHFDPAAVEHYKKELALLKQAGIDPLVTLQHFTLPQWVAEHGGWEWDGLPASFNAFVAYAQKNIGPDVVNWVTLNEPTIALTNGWINGVFPPAKRDIHAIAKPVHNMVLAHALAYHTLHTQNAKVRVGIAHHLRIFDPLKAADPADQMAATLMENVFDWSFMNAVATGHVQMQIPGAINIDEQIPEAAHTQDYLGVNYYSRDLVQYVPNQELPVALSVKAGAPVSDLGWEIYPDGMYRILKKVAALYPGLPIIITENGIADAHDTQRPSFIQDHLLAVSRAIKEGAPVEGYCHWSLMDNFEWAEGFTPRFGLYEVNYATLARTPRKSALLFRDIARTNSLQTK